MARKQQHIIDEQIRTWRFEQDALRRRSTSGRAWPLITISREFGARGRALADELAHRIGFTLWDRELVEAIADVSGGDRAIIAMLDERHRKAVEQMVFGAVIGGPKHTNARYFNTLLRVVRAIEQKGGSIIVGRGASYICSPESNLSVRVVCPVQERVRAYAEREDVAIDEAQRLVTERDRERADFILHNFREDVGAPTSYDVVINSGTYDLAAMGDIVLAAYVAKFGKRPPEASTSELPSRASHAA